MTPEQKAKIDAMSYRALFTIWRFAPLGDTILQGESGTYIKKRMEELEKTNDRVAMSKSIGW